MAIIAIDDNARMMVTDAFHPNTGLLPRGYCSLATAKLPSYAEPLPSPASHREIFFPAAFPAKVRKLRVDDFEVVRGQASLTAEARGTRVFCSVSLNFSVFRLFALPTTRSRFPARPVRPFARPLRFAGPSRG